MTPQTALKALLRRKSYRALGAEFGMDHAYLHRVASGGIEPSERLLELLGLERVVVVSYRKRQ